MGRGTNTEQLATAAGRRSHLPVPEAYCQRSVYAWGGFSSDGHEYIQDSLRTNYPGWQEESVELWDEDGLEQSDMTLGELVSELDHAVLAQKLPEDWCVYRGLKDLDSFCQIAGVQAPEELEGKTVTDPGYLATSTDREIAIFHAHEALLEIEAPQNTSALSLKSAGIPDQDEVLFARNSTLQIISVDQKHELPVLTARIIPS